MRFLSTILLLVFCLIAAVHSNAADIQVTLLPASYEYRAVERAVPNDALNDYHHITSFGNAVSNIAFQKENSAHFTGSAFKNASAYILNDSFQNNRLFFSDSYAKTFRIKLIFPQHYHW